MNIPSKMEFLRVNHLQMGRFPWLCWITRGLRSSRTLWDQNPPPFCQENHVAQLSKPIPRAKLSDAKPLLAQLGKFWSKNLSQLGLSFQYLSTKIENAPENGKHNFGSPEISKKLWKYLISISFKENRKCSWKHFLEFLWTMLGTIASIINGLQGMAQRGHRRVLSFWA